MVDSGSSRVIYRRPRRGGAPAAARRPQRPGSASRTLPCFRKSGTGRWKRTCFIVYRCVSMVLHVRFHASCGSPNARLVEYMPMTIQSQLESCEGTWQRRRYHSFKSIDVNCYEEASIKDQSIYSAPEEGQLTTGRAFGSVVDRRRQFTWAKV